jgi:hypothetical protein
MTVLPSETVSVSLQIERWFTNEARRISKIKMKNKALYKSKMVVMGSVWVCDKQI